MTENKEKIADHDKEKKLEVELDKEEQEDKKNQQQPTQKDQHDSKRKRLSQFLDMLNIPRYHSGHSGSSSSNTSPQTPHATTLTMAASITTAATTAAAPVTHTNGQITPGERKFSNTGLNVTGSGGGDATGIGVSGGTVNNLIDLDLQQQLEHHQRSRKRSSCISFRSEICLVDLFDGEFWEHNERLQGNKEDYGTQRVYKKTSPNFVLTLYLPTREIIISGNRASALRGIVFVDPKAVEGHRVYAQLTLTFRYGREDEEVMGLRFCNEAIMSLHQILPKTEEAEKATLSPLQEALLKRLGEGAHPFTLNLTAQAPPSVQLVPAKRYYGAPIGTSYDVRCYIADKTDEKFHRRASVKMGIRVIYRTDIFSHGLYGAVDAAVDNIPVSSPTVSLACTNTQTTTTPTSGSQTVESSASTTVSTVQAQSEKPETTIASPTESRPPGKPRKSERGDSFPKLRLSPKSFRFSGRFGRSKSEVDKCTQDSFHQYSKSFQEYDNVAHCAGPQGAVDKPFLLQDGRVGLKASLDKAWYTHGEDVCVTINIKNDSRKTVRKIRVCAIQHVDVCMFNNGKFKNVVADSDSLTPSPVDQHVAPGTTLNTSVILRPQRGPTKNWIALEDTLQRSTEPEEITATIAASAVRTPHFLMQITQSPNSSSSSTVFVPTVTAGIHIGNPAHDERNVFAIYVSYYVKVKLTLSGMGGELSLKLPFMLIHIDEEQRRLHENQKLNLDDVPANKKNLAKYKMPLNKVLTGQEFALDRIESMDENNAAGKAAAMASKASNLEDDNADDVRKSFKRTETIDQDVELDKPPGESQSEKKASIEGEDDDGGVNDSEQQVQVVAQIHTNSDSNAEANSTLGLRCPKCSKRRSNDLPLDDIQQLSEKLEAKEEINTQEPCDPVTNTNVV